MENNASPLADFQSMEFDSRREYKWFVYFDQANADRQHTGYVENLRELQNFATRYSPDRLYRDFVKIYDATEINVNPKTLDLIAEISESYYDDAANINYLFTLIYFALLSEHNKKNQQLGKRIKRLAVYQALFDKVQAEEVRYHVPRKWWLIDAQCSQRGF